MGRSGRAGARVTVMCLPALGVLQNWSQVFIGHPSVEIVESLVLRTVPLWLKALPQVRFTLDGRGCSWQESFSVMGAWGPGLV